MISVFWYFALEQDVGGPQWVAGVLRIGRWAGSIRRCPGVFYATRLCELLVGVPAVNVHGVVPGGDLVAPSSDGAPENSTDYTPWSGGT